MPKRIAVTELQASTIDILNTIRANASAEYQSLVPTVTTTQDIPKVGEVLYGYPAMANQFLSALMNRIALVVVKSALFNNPYAGLKKGYLEFGETVEEVYVNLSKAREFSAEKAGAREFKRTIPDVRTAFHIMNYNVQYPITIQDEDLRLAFTGENGVRDLISRIIDAVYTSAEYDEFLLFKYMIIKGITHGMVYPVSSGTTDIDKTFVKKVKSISNQLTFMGTKYNMSGVHTVTPKNSQHIFISADDDATLDVDVLASAFNMDKVTFMGHRHLIDDWTTFDNDRFSEIIENSDQIEEVTSAELALMANVQAFIVDDEWFQVYDNLIKMTETYVASGMYWNYFLNIRKTISSSPFANAIDVVSSAGTITLPASINVTLATKSVGNEGTAFTLEVDDSTASLVNMQVEFVQTEALTTAGIAVDKFGAVRIPSTDEGTEITLVAKLQGTTYTAGTVITKATAQGTTVTLAR